MIRHISRRPSSDVRGRASGVGFRASGLGGLGRLAGCLLALALLSACTSAPPPQAPAAAPDIPKIAFDKHTLPNGLEVILSEDHRVPMVAVNLWYHVGPANEAQGRTGFAHIFEHMMFQGTKHVPGDSHFKILEGAGATDINGTTDFDRTNYFETLPSNQLELALWMESDRMGYLLDKLDQANLSNQQDVIRNERRQGVENVPYGIVQEALFHQLFPKNHPYYGMVIGSHADIQAAKLEEVKSFFKLYYAPNNASLAIVGDFDKPEARKLVEKYFGPLKRGADVPKISAQTPPITAERRVVVRDLVELPKVYMAWITSPIFKPGDAEADLAARILGGGKSSRLYKKLVYEKQIAQDVSVQQNSLILGSLFGLDVTVRPGHTPEEVEAVINQEFDAFRRDGPTTAEVDRARNVVETQIVEGLETLGGFGGVADRLNLYNHYLGNPDYLAQDIERYRKATPASIRQFVQDQIKTNARVVVYGVPGTPDFGPDVPKPKGVPTAAGAGAESINADEAWRSQQPKAGPAKPLKVAAPQLFTLSNGLTVILAERPGLPIVSADLVVRTGSDTNPIDKPGLANYTAAMLDEGTTSRNALQLADDVAQLGASLTTGSSTDTMRVTGSSLSKNFAAMLGLMADVAQHPAFPADEIERQRGQRLGRLAEQRDDPTSVAGTALAAALYGPKHPYGYTEVGTEAAIKATTRDDLVGFWKRSFMPNNAALVVAGNMTLADLKTLAEQTFGSWQRATGATPSLGAPATTAARVVIVDKPGAAQSQIRVATIGAARSTPDYPALQVMNTALGGLFSSRINLNLREEHGYTYGAWTVFVYRRFSGPFFAATGVQTGVTAPAVSEILKEIRRTADAPLSADELSLSKDAIVRALPGMFETSGQVVGTLSNIYTYDLGLDYYAKYPAQIAAVNANAAQAAARKYLVPEKLLVVVVGDRKKVEPELARLKLGTIELRDADGNVKKK
jgi:zinc protease